MSNSRHHRSRNREETWREEELQKTLEDINRDLKRSNHSSSSHRRATDEKEKDSKHRSERHHRETKERLQTDDYIRDDRQRPSEKIASSKGKDDYSKSRRDSTAASHSQKIDRNKAGSMEKESERVRTRDRNEDRNDERRMKKERDSDKDKERSREKHKTRDKDSERHKEYSRENGRRERDDREERRERRIDKEEKPSRQELFEVDRKQGEKLNGSSTKPSHQRGGDMENTKKQSKPEKRALEPYSHFKKISSDEDEKYRQEEDIYEDDFENYEDDFDEEDGEENGATTANIRKGKMEDMQLNRQRQLVPSSDEESYNVKNNKLRNNRGGASVQESSGSKFVTDDTKTLQLITPRPTAGIRFTPSTFSTPAARRQWQRAEDIRRLVEFDFVDFPLFEMPPVDEYSRYISSFGHNGRSQATTQTHEDRLDREMQTEDIEVIRGKWTQHPPVGDLEGVCGMDSIVQNLSISKSKKTEEPKEKHSNDIKSLTDFSLFQKRSEQLNEVGLGVERGCHLPLNYCLTAILNILEEEASPQVSLLRKSKSSRSRKSRHQQEDDEMEGVGKNSSSNLHFSDGYTELTLNNSHIPSVSLPCVEAVIAPGDSNYLLTVHDVSESARFQRHVKSLLFLWRVPSVTVGGPSCGPQECFYSAQSVTSVQLSPDPQLNHVIAGLHDGSLLLWSRNSLHGLMTSSKASSGSMKTLLRSHLQMEDRSIEEESCWNIDSVQLHTIPSYNTAALLALGRNEQPHISPIVNLTIIHTQMSSTSKRAVPYQIASMDSQGTICLWIVNRITDRTDRIGSEADPGLTAGSKWSLALLTELRLNVELPLEMKNDILSATGDTRSNQNTKDVSRQTTLSLLYGLTECRTFVHKNGDTSKFFIGCVDGAILQQCRGKKQTVYPHEFSTGFGDTSPVTSLSFYPFNEDVFLAGYESGSVCLYHVSTSEPVHTWPNIAPSGIRKVAWSQSRPNIFFALDNNGMLCTWDLLQDRFSPVKSEKVQFLPFDDRNGSQREDRVEGFHLNGDYKAGTSEVKSVISPQIVLWSRQTIQVHNLAKTMSQPELDDTYKMAVIFMDLL